MPKRSNRPERAEPPDLPARPAESTLTRTAYERIRSAIIYGPLDLGEPLSENALARALGMSKAPVRAAMSELRVQGLVRVVPQSGTFVFCPTRQDVEELCDFRFLLEGRALAAAMAHDRTALVDALARIVAAMQDAAVSGHEARALDSAFHQQFIRGCDNRYLRDAYDTIGHRVEALRHRFMHTTVFRHKALSEHLEMLALLERGRTTRAVAVLGEHIARTRQFQAGATWSQGLARRRDYKFREHQDLFGPSAAGPEPPARSA